MEYRSSVRITIQCDNAENDTYSATGVAVSPYTIVTVKHLVAVCPIRGFLIHNFGDGQEYEAKLSRIAVNSDASMLRTTKPMEFYVPVLRREFDIKVGEYLCFVGGDRMGMINKKCGYVNGLIQTDKSFITSWAGVPGNSGGPVYDSYGRLVGIATHGRWEPLADQLAIVHSVNSFLDLL
jgi:S1-C subfamily serine protease